ncbi:MAG: HsdR family type I site-specific deoxyribonuclease [Chloroflexota bacterium]
MRNPGEIERRTQNRVVRRFQKDLGYDYLGNWTDRSGNQNVEDDIVLRWLVEAQGYDKALSKRALREVKRAAGDTGRSLYDRNRDVYQMLRYGVSIKPEAGEVAETLLLIDWDNPERNQFAVAEEVTVLGQGRGASTKRPDVVLYVNGIALAVLELKRSTVSVSEGIRQNIDSQKREFIGHFFSTVQFVMAGNDTEGLRYGVVETREKYYLTWKEASAEENPLDRDLLLLCEKKRFLELIHDFMLFDQGVKKVARHNQYFAVRKAQPFVERREGGIIWHAQGSGKSLTMVWLAKWIREHDPAARVLIITDRIELDGQIEGVFLGVGEKIVRTKSGPDLIARLGETTPWLMCSLIHKFASGVEGEDEGALAEYLAEIKKAASAGFAPKGNLFVFVDECHRTQSGDLHDAMKALMPDATFIGFTGTPLLKTDKKRSIEVFGPYIHTYKFDEAVADKVILDLRYEARDIEQAMTSQDKIDQWFELKTRGLTEFAKARLKRRWGTLSELFSSQSRLERIVADVLMDMEERDRFVSGRGNALLVCDSIYEACKVFELFTQKGLRGKVGIVTSYEPTPASVKGEDSGEGETERLHEYAIYRRMLADWFNEPEDVAVTKSDVYEDEVKAKFLKEPGQMKLLVVVDKLLTGFDAPPATYLYIDKQMQNHGLFQAVCRVNRLDDEDKDYGYIIDYKGLFPDLEGAVRDYTSGALDGYDAADVTGLLKDRFTDGRKRLEEAREAVKALCEPVEVPRDSAAYLRYFCSADMTDAALVKANEPSRIALYKLVGGLIRAYANIASELEGAGYSTTEAAAIEAEVDLYEKVRTEVRLASGDYIDLKMYEPAMRHLIDTYIRSEDSRKVSAFDDMSLVGLIAARGPEAVKALPEGIAASPDPTSDTITMNVRKVIIDQNPINPRYYERMSALLDGLLDQRRRAAISYREFLEKISVLARQVIEGPSPEAYPAALDSPAKRALYDNLGKNEALAVAVDAGVEQASQDGWRANAIKTRRVENAIRAALRAGMAPGGQVDEDEVMRILSLVTSRDEY